MQEVSHMTLPEGLHTGQKDTKLARMIREETTGNMGEVLSTLREEKRKIYLCDPLDRP